MPGNTWHALFARRSQPAYAGCVRCYLLADEAAPPGPLDAAAPPPYEPPVLLDAAPPGLAGALDEAAPPPAELLVPPVPLGLELELAAPGELELGAVDDDELDEPGAAGAVVVEEEEDEPPGTTIVSFSLVVVVVVLEVGGLPPGTIVVVSFRSHPERVKATAQINR